MQSRLLWIYIIGGILLFFAAIIALFFFLLPDKKAESIVQKVSSTTQSIASPFIEPAKEVLETLLPKQTLASEEESVSLVGGDVPSCEDEEGEEKKKCEDTVFLQASIYRGDINGCSSIDDEIKKMFCQDEILIEQVRKTKDFSLCGSIKSPLTQRECKKQELLVDMNKAKTKADCEKITDEEISSQCMKKFLTVEDFHFSPLKCNKIDDPADKKFCQQMTIQYSLSKGKNLSCDNIDGMEEFCFEQQALYMDRKYFSRAVAGKNIHLCSKIIDSSVRTECKDGLLPLLAWDKKDTAFCELLSTIEAQEKCLQENTENISIYYFRLAKDEAEKEYCDKILDPERKEKCYGIFIE
jgi:hypothetical protein